jgi:hypothetical protein
MRVWRCLAALGVALGVTGCGGSGHKPTDTPLSRAVSAAVAPVAPTVILPASSSGPTTCTVYESGYATQLIFGSESLNVSPECAAWSSQQSGSGYLWGYQPTSAAVDATAIEVCDLSDPSGRISANVVEDTGFAPPSAAQRTRSAVACSSMRAAGWTAHGRS